VKSNCQDGRPRYFLFIVSTRNAASGIFEAQFRLEYSVVWISMYGIQPHLQVLERLTDDGCLHECCYSIENKRGIVAD
jgi:hypothetical protein